MIGSVFRPPAAAPRRAHAPLIRRLGQAAAAAALLAAPIAAQASPVYAVKTVMSGLANPRGLAFGPDGGLYVAEAGVGGDGGSVTAGSGQVVQYGASGAVSRLLGGVQTRVAQGLPSLAGPGGQEATGPQDVAFDASGALHVAIGLGADPAQRSSALGAGAELLGHVVRIEGSTPVPVADIAGYEAAENPGGPPFDSNPFSLLRDGGGFILSDAGGNSVLEVAPDGSVSTRAVLPRTPNPLPFGPPEYDPVPTGLASFGGDVYVGELTGFPFIPDAARIWRIPGDGSAPEIFASGLTNLIDLAFGSDGTLYALEHDSDGILGGGDAGALYRVGADGSLDLLLAMTLIKPTGLAIGADGAFYVSDNGTSATDGRVVRVSLVPLPATLPLLGAGVLVVAGLLRRTGRT